VDRACLTDPSRQPAVSDCRPADLSEHSLFCLWRFGGAKKLIERTVDFMSAMWRTACQRALFGYVISPHLPRSCLASDFFGFLDVYLSVGFRQLPGIELKPAISDGGAITGATVTGRRACTQICKSLDRCKILASVIERGYVVWCGGGLGEFWGFVKCWSCGLYRLGGT